LLLCFDGNKGLDYGIPPQQLRVAYENAEGLQLFWTELNFRCAQGLQSLFLFSFISATGHVPHLNYLHTADVFTFPSAQFPNTCFMPATPCLRVRQLLGDTWGGHLSQHIPWAVPMKETGWQRNIRLMNHTNDPSERRDAGRSHLVSSGVSEPSRVARWMCL